MIGPADVLALSLLVTDASGVHPLKPIGVDAAEAISNECTLHPFTRYPWVPADLYCAALYTFHSFRESGWNLKAVGDGGKAHGPFQVWGRAPRSWADACSVFTKLLQHASVCEEPLEMLAAGKCGTRQGQQISKVRTGGAMRLVFMWFDLGVGNNSPEGGS